MKGLLAVAALAVAVTGGWWHYRQKQVREQERVAAEAAEEAHQKASANKKKKTAEKWLAGLQNEGAQDYGGESFIKIVALHAAGTNAFSRGAYTIASAQFGEMIKVAPECKQAIEHAKKQAQEKRTKENAEKMKSEAEAAAKECERLNVVTFAEQSWNKAAASLKDANNKFKYGDFSAASNAFAIAVSQFEICANEVAAVFKAKEAVVPIHKQALERQGRLKDVSGDEDIEASNNDLANTFAQADKHFSDKERRWSEAAALFTNYVTKADKLIRLYEERRQAADAARTKAESAKVSAGKEGAEQYANTSWENAVKCMKSANDKFEGKRFVSAAKIFKSVAEQFDQCANEAKNNKAVRALLGTWECSMRREGITKPNRRS